MRTDAAIVRAYDATGIIWWRGRCCLDNALPRNTLHYVAILSTESPPHFQYNTHTHMQRRCKYTSAPMMAGRSLRINYKHACANMLGVYGLRVLRTHVCNTHVQLSANYPNFALSAVRTECAMRDESCTIRRRDSIKDCCSSYWMQGRI